MEKFDLSELSEMDRDLQLGATGLLFGLFTTFALNIYLNNVLSEAPTPAPTKAPSAKPSAAPTRACCSEQPSNKPTPLSSFVPTLSPKPSAVPTKFFSAQPSLAPSNFRKNIFDFLGSMIEFWQAFFSGVGISGAD